MHFIEKMKKRTRKNSQSKTVRLEVFWLKAKVRLKEYYSQSTWFAVVRIELGYRFSRPWLKQE